MKVGGIEGWCDVIDIVRKRLHSWGGRYISMGGRSTLIQFTLSSIPLYWLSFLPLPKAVEARLRSLLCSFLWGGREDKKKIVWLRWEEVCRPKKEGGLGIKDLNLFNWALLCKWV